MPAKSLITDSSNGKTVEVDDADGEEQRALIVATRPLKTATSVTVPFSNDTYGIDMNINASSTAVAAENVHDGLDNVYWTGSTIAGGGVNFNDAAQNHTPAGAFSIHITQSNGNVCQFTRPAGLFTPGQSSFGGWIYITSWPLTGDKYWYIVGFNTSTGVVVGDSVELGQYIDKGILNTWQEFSIPINDFNLGGNQIDALRCSFVDIGSGRQQFFLDDLEFPGGGAGVGTQIFHCRPEPGTWLTIKKIKISIADGYDSTIGNGTMYGLAYDDILGTVLSPGLTYQRIQSGEVMFSTNIKTLADLLYLPGSELKDVMYDGTNTFITIEVSLVEAEILKDEDEDELRVILSEDLSGYEYIRMVTRGSLEQRR